MSRGEYGKAPGHDSTQQNANAANLVDVKIVAREIQSWRDGGKWQESLCNFKTRTKTHLPSPK